MRYRFMRFPEGRSKAVTFSYDDGSMADIRLSEIFTRYGMKCTFNLNRTGRNEGWTMTPQQIRENIIDRGHEVALHGFNHIALGTASATEGIREVLDCRLDLERQYGMIIRGYAYADSGINNFTGGEDYAAVRSYLSQLGVVYARALGEKETDFKLPRDFYRWYPSAHHDDPELMGLIDKFLGLDLSTNTYCASRAPRLLYIWGHSFEFNKKGNWERIEEICQKLSGKDEIWYATNMEIYEYISAYHSLILSADGSLIYNPTLIDLWVDIDGKLYMIPSGRTVEIN